MTLFNTVIRMSAHGWRAALLTATLGLAAACGGGRSGPPAGGPSPSGSPRSSLGPQGYDVVSLFRGLGLLARGAPLPFVGSVSFFASEFPDSTHTLVAVSLANTSLTFARESDRYRAGYSVTIVFRNGPTVVRNIEAHETVVVGSFKETTRTDESILFEEVITIPPGRYEFTVSVRDDGSARTTEDAATLEVPASATVGLSTPVSFARATLRTRLGSIPQIIVNPTAAAIFGRDSVIPFFLEGYGSSDSTHGVQYAVRSEDGRGLFVDSTTLMRHGAVHSGTINIQASRLGIGAMTLTAWSPGSPDTVRAPMFVGFGANLPLASYDEMVNYLRWFASPFSIQKLKDTPPEARPAAWAEFVDLAAEQHRSTEALREYFVLMADANARFREEASPGWMTDRGRVLLGLGRPDQVYEQPARTLSERGRQQLWEYSRENVVITFFDQSGFGRWRLTQSSEAEFMTAWRRRVQ
ncbi:MAG: GWxTD domain-containing protein [Gemmatimonadetes bacterium]|nr:GWxTD domain-containing protein [Gemmatimonadota bacterium]